MSVREQILETVATTADEQLLAEVYALLRQHQAEAAQPPISSFAAFEALQGSVSNEVADEMQAIMDREFNTIEGEL